MFGRKTDTNNSRESGRKYKICKTRFSRNRHSKLERKCQNTLNPWTYNYAYFDKPASIGSTHSDSTLQVTQFDDGGGILTQRQLYIEIYARNIGMVYKQVIDIGSQPASSWNLLSQQAYTDSATAFYAIPILQRINSGTQYSMTLNSYGIEL